jgi:hypothetical protein
MPAVLPPGLTLARRGQSAAHALTIAVLAVPLVIVTVALIPAFVICPFLTAAHRQHVTGLLASLRQWTAALTGSAPDSATPYWSLRSSCCVRQRT